VNKSPSATFIAFLESGRKRRGQGGCLVKRAQGGCRRRRGPGGMFGEAGSGRL